MNYDDDLNDPPEDARARKRIEQRRAFRLAERRRIARRNRTIVITATAFIVIAVVLLVTVGPLKSTFFGKAKGAKASAGEAVKKDEGKKDDRKSDGKKATAKGSQAKSTAPESNWHYYKASDVRPPTIGIVVDDVGNNKEFMNTWLAIDAPICFAVMPYPPLSEELANTMFDAGQVVMMHIPTDNQPPNSFSGKGQLATGMDKQTVFSTLDADLKAVPHAMGVNNHQGGRGCDQLDLMTYEVQWAKSKGMFVVDSASSNNSKVTTACKALGLPRRCNQVFIDHTNDPAKISAAMRELAGIAKKNGTAIGICHWHRPFTAITVGSMIKTLKAEGIHFAFARDISN